MMRRTHCWEIGKVVPGTGNTTSTKAPRWKMGPQCSRNTKKAHGPGELPRPEERDRGQTNTGLVALKGVWILLRM